MKRVLIVLFLTALAPALFASTAKTVAPDWAKYFPDDTILVVGFRDFSSTVKELLDNPPKDHKGISLYKMVDEVPADYREDVIRAFKDISGFASYFPGSLAVGFIGPSFDELKPLVVAPIKTEGLHPSSYIEINLLPLLRKIYGPVSLSIDGRYFVIYLGTEEEDAPRIYFTIHEDILYASTDGKIIEKAIVNPPVKGRSLYSNPSFISFFRSLKEPGLIAWLNTARLYKMSVEKMESYGKTVCEAFGFDDVTCVGFGIGRTPSHFVIETAVEFRDAFDGLPRMLAQPGIVTNSIYLVPEDYSIFACVSVADADAAWYAWKEAVRKVLDNIGWNDYLKYLNDWDEKHGIVFEKDVIENLGDEVAAALRFNDENKIPDILLIGEVRNKKEADETIEKAVEKKEYVLVKKELKSPKDYLNFFYVNEKQYCYVYHKKYVIAAQGEDLVMEALEAWDDDESLDASKPYRAIEKGLPEANIAFVYVDEKQLDECMYNWLEKRVLKSLDSGKETPESDAEEMEELDNLTGPDTEKEPGLIDEIVKEFPDLFTKKMLKEIKERLDTISKQLSATTINIGMEDDILKVSTSISLVQMRYLLGESIRQLPPILIKRKAEADSARSISNIKQICLAAKQYAMDNKEKFPERLSQMHPDYLYSLEVLKSPGAKTAITVENMDTATNYRLVKGLDETMPSETILVYEDKPLMKNMVSIGVIDGSARQITVEERDRLLEEQRNNRRSGQ